MLCAACPPEELSDKAGCPKTQITIIIIIYYSWNGGRAEAVCAGEKGVRMR